jgi:hypothetical protein
VTAIVAVLERRLDSLSSQVADCMNAETLDEEGNVDRVRASYGDAKHERLATIKAKYDPDNVFRRNANIKRGVPLPIQPVDLTESESSRAR